ncbi:MAG: hypothetical protein KJ697_01430 [Nanoarchaeota archaeon]|nr:hypothetical protein [Nanoarchaeota archaeon]MBU4124022.1 hypothetical protein [Nanoarchaeota archaeon]
MGRNNNTDKAITKSARSGYFGMYNCKPIEDTTTKRSKQHISYLMRSRHRASVCKNDLYNTIEIKTFNTKSDTLIHQLAIPHLNININNPAFGYGTTIMNEGAMILDFINPQNDDQHRKNSIELLVGESTKRTRKNSVVDVVDLRNIDYNDDI